jgi:hypothetical protein
MRINQREEQFSRAYVHAVASVAGYALYKPYVDDDSIDCGIAARGDAGIFFSPRVELQLKSSSRDIVKKGRSFIDSESKITMIFGSKMFSCLAFWLS